MRALKRVHLADGEPIGPSPTINQAINGGYPWLQIECSRSKMPTDVDMAALAHPPPKCVHDLAGRLRCEKRKKAGKRPPAALLQVTPRARHAPTEQPTPGVSNEISNSHGT